MKRNIKKELSSTSENMMYAEAIIPYHPKTQYVPPQFSYGKNLSARSAIEVFLERIEIKAGPYSYDLLLKESQVFTPLLFGRKKYNARLIFRGESLAGILQSLPAVSKNPKPTPLDELTAQLRASLHPIQSKGSFHLQSRNLKEYEQAVYKHFEERLKPYFPYDYQDASLEDITKTMAKNGRVELVRKVLVKDPFGREVEQKREFGVFTTYNYQFFLTMGSHQLQPLDVILPIRHSFLHGAEQKIGQFDAVESTKYPRFELKTQVTKRYEKDTILHQQQQKFEDL